MKKLLKELRSKSLWVYILSFSAIMLFIVLIMGSYLYWFYYRTIYRDFESSNKEYLSSLSGQHENDMQVLDDIMTQLSLAGSNVEFILRSQPKKSFELKDMLHQYISVSKFFSHIFFFYHEDQYLYNHSTSIAVERFLDRGIRLENCPREKLKNLLYWEERGMAVLPEQNVEGYLVENMGEVIDRAVVYVLPMEPKRDSTVLFLVGEKYYDRLLGSEKKNMRQTTIFYQGVPVVSRGTLAVNPRLPEGSSGAQTQGQYEIKENEQKYLVTWMTGDSGLVYCTVQSAKVFQNKIMTGQWGILLVLAICSIPTSLAFWTLSKSLSGKVRNINALLGAEETYGLDNLENGVRVLVENHRESNEENLLLRRTRFVSDLIRGQFTDRTGVLHEAGKVKLEIDRPYFGVVLMGDHGNSNENEAHEMMLGAIAGRRSVDGYGIHLINSNQSLYVISGDSRQELEAALEELFVIGKNHCEEFVMSVSDYHNDFTKAATAYLEADSAYSTRLLVDNGRIIYFKDVKFQEKAEMFSDMYLQRLKNAIRTQGKIETKMIIQEICGSLRSSGQSLLAFRVLCNDIIHMLLTEWAANTSDFGNIYSVFSLSQCLTINDFHDILWEVCSKLMESAHQPEGERTDFVNEAVNYMKQNYQDAELNMSSLADYLGVSGVTLAVKFKNAMEISPSDYLAILRMEQAKTLLKGTDMQVKEISLAVGYEDAHVFMRRFKKYTGLTPGQYRVQETEEV